MLVQVLGFRVCAATTPNVKKLGWDELGDWHVNEPELQPAEVT